MPLRRRRRCHAASHFAMLSLLLLRQRCHAIVFFVEARSIFIIFRRRRFS
jgi:hypothetical protein